MGTRLVLALGLLGLTGEVAFFCLAYSWPTRIGFTLGLLIFAALAVRWKEKRTNPQFDDHLSFERMDRAREWLVSREVEKRHLAED